MNRSSGSIHLVSGNPEWIAISDENVELFPCYLKEQKSEFPRWWDDVRREAGVDLKNVAISLEPYHPAAWLLSAANGVQAIRTIWWRATGNNFRGFLILFLKTLFRLLCERRPLFSIQNFLGFHVNTFQDTWDTWKWNFIEPPPHTDLQSHKLWRNFGEFVESFWWTAGRAENFRNTLKILKCTAAFEWEQAFEASERELKNLQKTYKKIVNTLGKIWANINDWNIFTFIPRTW